MRLIDAPGRWEIIVDVPKSARSPGEIGHGLMELESQLRRKLALPIEVYSPVASDLSKLRKRLQNERGRQVDDWLARRAETKVLGRTT